MNETRRRWGWWRVLVIPGLLLAGVVPAWPEAMVQYFNTSWVEITEKMPELAEAGYSSIWLPPPTKGSGGLSVGYDLWDPFDLGGKDQCGSYRTRYGTEAELLILMETAHRFGIRIYFDNIMNHRAFSIPGYDEWTPIDIYPGMVPEDFHLRVTEAGFYRKWDNTRDWNSAWQVQNLGLADLIDTAQEPGDWNENHGYSEGSWWPKIRYLRQPYNPEYYCYLTNGTYVGFGASNGITVGYLASNSAFYAERVEDFLNRAVRWLVDRTRCDGLRLDAVKHVRADFFGASGAGKDESDYGYTGQAQRQFNLTRGFSDANHRDSLFETENNRDDLMIFGEHLGEPPGYGDYVDRGMRLVDNPLRNELNGRLGSPWAGLNGYDSPGYGGFSPNTGVMHAQSHDNDYAARRELQHCFYFTRAGLGLIYTDGNHHAGTLGESGGAFPRHANTAFLGQWGDNRVPNLLYVHEQFARGYQRGVWSDGDYVAWERLDWRQGGSTDADKVTLLVMLNDNYSAGQARDIRGNLSFPHTGGGSDAYLYNYSSYGGGFYKYASQLNEVVVPAGGYFLFSWKNPDDSFLWNCAGGRPITIYENGREAGMMSYVRRDGPDGDANFNPYGVADTNATDYAYTYSIPRITSPTNIRIAARVDGSAKNVLIRLDGGVNINSQMGLGPQSGDLRDNAPALANDCFLGYEQARFVLRQHKEKFAAADSVRDKIGSAGAETYIATIGRAGFNTNHSNGVNDWDNSETASWIWHQAEGQTDTGAKHFWPLPQNAIGTSVVLWVKSGYQFNINRMVLYYTTNGTTWPEGAGGEGQGETRTLNFDWDHTQTEDGNVRDWWKVTLPAMPSGTVFRYKIGGFRQQDGGIYAPWQVVWPGGSVEVAKKTSMMGVWDITNFNPGSVVYQPHYDYGPIATGLVEGFHIICARPFLERDNRAAIYNTFKQTFYYDALCPTGVILYPASNGESLGGQQYGVVVRSDPSVVEVWFHIDDADPNNDDIATGVANGNGNGFEPYTDSNSNGARDTGEAFNDLNGNGIWDANIGESWVPAYATTPYEVSTRYPREWRFNYNNIPPGGSNATIKVRLRELSSAGRGVFTNHTDASGHFTTLTRTVYTWGPDVRMFVAWPQKDGDLVSSGYVMKVYFTKSLADGLTEQQLIDRMLIKIQSSESGRTTGGVAQSRSDYDILYNDTADYHALAFTLGNLYNGDPDWLHGIEVTMERPSQSTLLANRLVKAAPAAEAPYIAIVEPAEYGPDGNPVEIIIPDVVSPSNEQRQTNVRIATGTNGATVSVAFNFAPTGYLGTNNGGMGLLSVTNEGSTKFWEYRWTNLLPGQYRFTATVGTYGGVSNSAARNATVVKREWVNALTNDYDDDDDGLSDTSETTATALPASNSETWNNGDVHVYYAYGRSNPQSPDTDGDGLPDGLELGWRNASGNTDTNADTNGDGWKNFRPDLDPPFFNTLDNYDKVPGVSSLSQGGDRARQLYGSMTDPANPDTDYDGLPDGIEDANRNGWVDGDGQTIDPTWDPWLGRAWPNNRMDTGETWTETNPNDSDSDDDGLTDGYGEDKNFNGRIDGDANTNRVYDASEEWTETDPLKADTDGDGLPDGWETQNNLDPLDNGTNSLRTAAPNDGNPTNGAAGDPDADGFNNAVELANGTNPRYADTGVPPPAGSIVIGRGAALGVVNGVTNYQEFTDWTAADLIALDDYNNGGSQAVDIYRAWDGFDSSRDIVAFYAHDGGAADGKFYFRIDLQDLQGYAEDGYLDLYVIIDTGNPAVGEYSLPDSADMVTEMRWEAAVAVYGGNNGRVYVDTQRANNSLSALDDLTPYGVVARDQNTANGFKEAYFNSELDAVEFSISRQALLDAGWNGLNPADLNFQVFTMKDGTQNSPVGPGDIGYRNDLRDSLTDDWVCSDYWRDQDNIIQNGRLYSWVGLSAGDANDRGKAAKVAFVAHGNQAIQPGSVIQNLVNNGSGAGYYRPLVPHAVYRQPLNLHITPTLAAAIQWARVDTNISPAWRDGPALNAWIAELIRTNVVHLLGSTFSDHMLPYFTSAFNNDNANLARDYLQTIYGVTFTSNTVFWTPERLVDADVLGKVLGMGYRSTLIDQNTHMWSWFGRNTALSDDGYRINRIHGVDCFVINNDASRYRFLNTDQGLNMPLRELFSRRARSGTQDQVVTLFSNWEDFGANASADAYDKNVRWIANHPWVQAVALEEVATGQVDLTGDGHGDDWWRIDRGAATLSKQGHDWVNHSSQGNYDNWYVGSALEEGLQGKVFEVRPGVNVPQAYGMVYFSGIISSAWQAVSTITNVQVARLARSALHASVFQTAWHEEDNNNLSRFSTGDYMYPDTSWNSLIGFAKHAQSQSRFAAIYKRLDQWAGSAAGLGAATNAAQDVDLDGENEYLLYNDRLFTVFERCGGRMVGAWVRNPADGGIYQVVGNVVGYSGSETEWEGAYNVETNWNVTAFRTSCFKDWWAGTTAYVNDLYGFTNWTNGWRIASTNGKIIKTVTLAPASGKLEARYQVNSGLNGGVLYVRHGLTPNLASLLTDGQAYLGAERQAGGVMSLPNSGGGAAVSAAIGYADAGHNTGFNLLANDDNPAQGVAFYTINMRNQAQTHQVELVGTNDFMFALEFAAQTASADADGDGIPDDYETQHFGSPANASGITDYDHDGMLDWQEYVAGSNPTNPNSVFVVSNFQRQPASGFRFDIPTISNRRYSVWYANGSLSNNARWVQATNFMGSGSTVVWTDDGSATDPDPPYVTNRQYRVRVGLQ